MKAQWTYSLVFLISTIISMADAQNPGSFFDKTNSNNNKLEENSGTRPASKSSSGNYNTYLYLGEVCSMCLYNNWKPGTLILKDKTIITDRFLRYNIYNQQMEFIFESDTSAIANPDDFEKIIFGGHTFVYGPFLCNESIHRGYMELLYDGEISLLLHRYVKYKVMDKNPYVNAKTNQAYYREDRYFYSDHQGPAKPLPLKKKQLIELFNNPEKNAKLFMKETKNKLSTKEDLINLFEFYFSNSPA